MQRPCIAKIVGAKATKAGIEVSFEGHCTDLPPVNKK